MTISDYDFPNVRLYCTVFNAVQQNILSMLSPPI